MPFSRTQPLRVITFDDQPIFLRGMNALLAQEPNICLAGSVSNEDDLMQLLSQEQATILLIDHAISPVQNQGLNLIRAVSERYAQLHILVISSFYSTTTVAHALRSGAKGFICKYAAEEVLLKAVQAVGSGEIYLEPEMAMLLARMHEEVVKAEVTPESATSSSPLIDSLDMTSLSPKVQGVMRCLLEGMTVTEIARKFSRSIKTISGQKQTGMRKLGIRNDFELMLLRNNL